jgi:hypothetical protein
MATNFGDIQTEVKDLLNFTAATDQDFTDEQVRQAIRICYKREVNRAKQQGGRNWFKKFFEFTWESDETTRTLPEQLKGKDLISFLDVTNVDPGYEIQFDDQGFGADVFWKDNETLQWGTNGPGSDRTIRVTYYADAEELQADNEEPTLIPDANRQLLVWASAIYLRLKADELAPAEWRREYNEHQLDYWKVLSRGRPSIGNEPTITEIRPDTERWFVY